jgi:hypothetical protein
MKSNKTIIWILILLVVGAGLYMVLQNKNAGILEPNPVIPTENPANPNNPAQTSDKIVVSNIKEGDSVDATNGFTVTGKAVGGWYFEASAPVTIYSKDGKTLGGSYIQAQGDWMQAGFVDFKGEIPPFLTGGATEGYILFQNDNPSDDEGYRWSHKINVTFPTQETQTIKLYFGNSNINPNAADCAKVFAVTRVVPKTSSIGTLTLKELLKGTTNGEVALGYTSAFGNGAGYTLKTLTVSNSGVAIADFSYLPSGGSCLVGEARAQIETTLKQFPTVKSVKILLNGSEGEALQP